MSLKSVDDEGLLAESLFLNDNGQLPLEARKVLVHLLSGPSLEARKHSKLWPILLQHEILMRSRLSDLFLELIIDREQEIAFTRQAEIEEIDVPLLLRRAPLTYIDSVLLLYLRQQLARNEGQGERAVVSTEEIYDYLKIYSRTDHTDHALTNKRASSSIEKMKNYSILRKTRGNEDRFEISPTLKILFSGDEVLKLQSAYDAIAKNKKAVQDSEDDEEESEL